MGRWSGELIDVDGHPGQTTPQPAAADSDEVGGHQVHDSGGEPRPIVCDDPFDAATGPANSDDRAAWQTHRGRAVVIPAGVTAQLVATGLDDNARGRPRLMDGGSGRWRACCRLAWIDDRTVQLERVRRSVCAIKRTDRHRRLA